MNPVITDILQQFAEEAAFLWDIRGRVVHAPHISLVDLERFDERLEAHLDGLRIAGDGGWEVARSRFAGGDGGCVFAAAILAFQSGKSERIDDIIKEIGDDLAKARAVISALGWLPFEHAEPYIHMLLSESSAFHRYIGIAASALHCHDPGRHLDKALSDTFPPLIARGLRAHGELGRNSLRDDFRLQDFLNDHDESIRFSAAWSAALAGSAEAIEVLTDFIAPRFAYAEKAMHLAIRRMPHADALDQHRRLAHSGETMRLATISAGAVGDPALVPWLIKAMENPALARVAGEAFALITGADIDDDELRGGRPEGFNAGPNDDPQDSNVALDVDDDLPWPDPELVQEWWAKNQGRFQKGTRHLLGKPITPEHLRHILVTGLQRQRAAAALELVVLNPGRPLFEVRGPAFRQRDKVAAL